MDVAARSRTLAIAPLGSLVGLMVWAAVLIVLPASTAARVFLAAPLLIVPLLAVRLPPRVLVRGAATSDIGVAPCIPAGLLLAAALALPAGPLAAAAALPWIALTAVCGLAALRHGLSRPVVLFAPSRTVDLAADGAFGFLAIGGVFLLFDRLDVAMLGSGPPYTLLGAIHYHFAGFGLLALLALVAGKAGTGAPKRRHWLAALALIAGVAITAVGLIVDSPAINWLGVLSLAAGGLAVAWSFVSAGGHGWRRLALVGAAVGLTGGLLMGVGWASAVLFGVPFVGMEQMVRSHGALNATAVVLATLALALPRLTGGHR